MNTNIAIKGKQFRNPNKERKMPAQKVNTNFEI